MGIQILQSTCLKTNYSLRRQLVVSYGITAFVTIFVVVLMATSVSIRASNQVNYDTKQLFTTQVTRNIQESGLIISNIFTKRIDNIKTSTSLLREIIQDRIVGYPTADFVDDTYVPFKDRESSSSGQSNNNNKYPLQTKLLPRDWEIVSNLNEDNIQEHTQERSEFFKNYIGQLSTETGMFFFPGNCNPNHTSPNQQGYFPLCTDDNNNATLGGVKRIKTTGPLEQKAADISVFMKAIWEAEPLALQINIHFFNSGEGAVVAFPSFPIQANFSYPSGGCDWMKNINIYTNEPYATEEEIANCSPEGTIRPVRLFNGMERQYCADQALHPGQVRIYGPYPDVAWGTYRITVGEAVFDRRTGHFIACTALDISLDLAEGLFQSIAIEDRVSMAVTRPDGTVVAEPGNSFKANATLKLYETDFIDKATYDELIESIDFWNEEWDEETISDRNNIAIESDGRIYSVYLSPPPPEEYDPSYEPDFLIFAEIDVEDIYDVVSKIEAEIDQDVTNVILTSVAFALIGLVVLLCFLWIVSNLLTQPLKWMEYISWQIVNHSDERVGKSLVVVQDYKDDPLVRCTPRTEATDLVEEFGIMISGFSGTGSSRVANMGESEVRNAVTWKEEFRDVYEMSNTEQARMKEELNIMSQSVGRRMSRKRSSITKLDPADIAKLALVEEEADFRSTEMNLDGNLLQSTGESFH